MRTKLLIFLFSFCFFGIANSQFKAERKLVLMGSDFQIVCIAETESKAEEAATIAIREIQKIESEISSWDKNSYTSKINNNAGIAAVKVPSNLFYLIKRCKKLSELSQGAFDISINPLFDIWNFKTEHFSFPTKETIEATLKKVSFKNIVLDEKEKTVFLTKKNMRIGFGAIGKGYAADVTKKRLQKIGIQNGLINASGDLCAWGKDLKGKDWKIAIQNPTKKNSYAAWLDISNKAVATSGNYEKFVLYKGEKYSHILNPKTGYPVMGVQSVSIISPTAELSDGFATTIFVLGVEKGLKLVNDIIDLECIIIDDLGKIHFSKNIKINRDE